MKGKKRLLPILGLLLSISGCSSLATGTDVAGANPAAPPAPPAEMPAALVFPRTISIDNSAIETDPSAALQAGLKVGDPITADLITLSQSAGLAYGFTQRVLDELNELEIRISKDQTRFEGTLLVDDVLKNIKIDFGDFDYDGDGLTEGCSGHTAALPVCYRIWIGNTRAIAGVMETYAFEDKAGTGRFKGFPFNSGLEGQFGASYDHEDPEDKTTEIFVGAEATVRPGASEIVFTEQGHIVATQEGPDGAALKTINSAERHVDYGGAATDRRQIGRYRDGVFFIGLSKESGYSGEESYTAACAEFSPSTMASVVESQECADRGLDVGEVGFVRFMANRDVTLPPPSAFPFSAGF